MARAELIVTAKNGILKYTNAKIFPRKKQQINPAHLLKAELACDMFCRSVPFKENELFNKNDTISSYSATYDDNDVPLSENLRPKMFEYPAAVFAEVYDAPKTESAKLIKNGKTLYWETLYGFYIDFPWRRNEEFAYIQEKVEDFGFNTVANIIHNSVSGREFCKDYANKGFSLLREGYPLESVVKYMDEATLHSKSGAKRFHSNIIDFIIQAGDKRDLVIVKDQFGNERFDNLAEYAVYQFQNMLSEKELEDAIVACRTIDGTYGILMDEDFYKVAKKIINRDKAWTQENTDLIKDLQLLKQIKRYSGYKNSLEKTFELIDKNSTTDAIRAEISQVIEN